MKCTHCNSEENVKKFDGKEICCSCFLFTHSWKEWHALKGGSVKVDKEQLKQMREFVKNPPKKSKKQKKKTW